MMTVKPRAGLKVRDPVSRLHIPEEGIEVPEDSFWLRRIADGDVTRVECVQISDSLGAPEAGEEK